MPFFDGRVQAGTFDDAAALIGGEVPSWRRWKETSWRKRSATCASANSVADEAELVERLETPNQWETPDQTKTNFVPLQEGLELARTRLRAEQVALDSRPAENTR